MRGDRLSPAAARVQVRPEPPKVQLLVLAACDSAFSIASDQEFVLQSSRSLHQSISLGTKWLSSLKEKSIADDKLEQQSSSNQKR